MPSQSRELAAALTVASRQNGMITAAQARTAGLSRGQILRLVRSGTWSAPLRGRYLVHEVSPLIAKARAAVAFRRGAVVCDVTAARLHGFRALPEETPDEPVHLMARKGGSGRSATGTVVHRSDPGEPEYVQCIPVTSVDRTIADLVLTRNQVDAVALMDEALYLGKVATLDQARRLTVGRRGSVACRPWWNLADGRAESPLETRFRLLLADHGIVPDELQFPVVDPATGILARLDFAWPELRLCVEVDGVSVHDAPRALHTDRHRQNMLVALRWTVHRFTYADVVWRPDYVVRTVSAEITASREQRAS